jgi:hypothetical protein
VLNHFNISQKLSGKGRDSCSINGFTKAEFMDNYIPKSNRKEIFKAMLSAKFAN